MDIKKANNLHTNKTADILSSLLILLIIGNISRVVFKEEVRFVEYVILYFITLKGRDVVNQKCFD